MLSIDLKPLSEGTHHFEWTPGAEDLDLDAGVFHSLFVKVDLDYQPDRILVRLHASGKANLVCDRTLVDYEQGLDGDHVLLFVDEAFLEGQEDTYEDIRVLAPGEEFIDLAESARDTLMLSLPLRRVAPGAEDAPIQLQYGIPGDGKEQIDPRWEALRKLRTNKNET